MALKLSLLSNNAIEKLHEKKYEYFEANMRKNSLNYLQNKNL